MRKLPQTGANDRSWSPARRFHGWLATWLQDRRRSRAVPRPNAPSNLVASSNLGYVGLTWQDNSNNETGFRIYHRPFSDPFVVLANVNAGVTSFADWSAELGISYTYYVVAVNAAGESAPSNQVISGLTGA